MAPRGSRRRSGLPGISYVTSSNLFDGVNYWTGSGGDTVFIDGTKAMTLRGPTVAQDFKQIVIDYIEKRYGQGHKAAE